MKARWKGVFVAMAVAGAASIAFVYLFYGIDLDAGMAVHQVTRKGALWVASTETCTAGACVTTSSTCTSGCNAAGTACGQ
jgi:hypothetical protein